MAEKELNKIIDDKVEKVFTLIKEDLTSQGSVPHIFALFDTEGNAHAPGVHDMQPFFNEHKHQFADYIKGFQKFLKEEDNIETVESVIFQTVYYQKVEKSKADEFERTGQHTKISDNPDATQAMLVIRENKELVDFKMYELIFSDDETSCVISEKPTEAYTIQKGSSDGDKMSGNFVGHMD